VLCTNHHAFHLSHVCYTVSCEHLSNCTIALSSYSVCERYFGLAVADIIQPTGQDLALQCDLRFVALDHFTLACDNAIRANNEQLVVDAATCAWNTNAPLVDLPDCRDRLQPVQRRILDDLIQCKGAAPR
jgi:hypothetical protein